MPADVFKRFVPTPIKHSFEFQGVLVRVETNHQVLADRLLAVLPHSGRELVGTRAFIWRVVVESEDDSGADLESMRSHQLSQDGLTLVTLGQKSFLACDLRAHEGMSFVSERFVKSEELFQKCFLPAMVSSLKGLS